MTAEEQIKRIADKTALKAAETIREYCKSIPVYCEGCIFNKNDPEGLFFKGCFLWDNDPPETWEIKKIKEGEKR